MQEYWSGLPFPTPGALPNLGRDRIEVSCIGRWVLYCWEAPAHTQMCVPAKMQASLDEYMYSSQVVLEVKNPPANVRDVRDTGSIPVLGRSPGGQHGDPL